MATAAQLREEAKREREKSARLKKDGLFEFSRNAMNRARDLERKAADMEPKKVAAAAGAAEEGAGGAGRDRKASVKAKDEDFEKDLKEMGWADESAGAVVRIHGGAESRAAEHRKKALQLKREGKVQEAIQEMKAAKLADKEAEDEKILGMAMVEDPDEQDEDLMHLMDMATKEIKMPGRGQEIAETAFDFLAGIDLAAIAAFGTDVEVQVSDADLDMPDMDSALQELGWSDGEEDDQEGSRKEVERLRQESSDLKRSALSLKRAGKLPEAGEMLRRAKVADREADALEERLRVTAGSRESKNDESGANDRPAGGRGGAVDRVETDGAVSAAPLPAVVQVGADVEAEVRAVKLRALALKREGKVQEAMAELRKARDLESGKVEQEVKPLAVASLSKPAAPLDLLSVLREDSEEDDDGDVDVTEDDENDPAMAAMLQGMGFQEDAPAVSAMAEPRQQQETDPVAVRKGREEAMAGNQNRTRQKLEEEVSDHRRQALLLKRQGRIQEAAAEMRLMKAAEAQLAELAARQKPLDVSLMDLLKEDDVDDDVDVTEDDENDPAMAAILSGFGFQQGPSPTLTPAKLPAPVSNPSLALNPKESPASDRKEEATAAISVQEGSRESLEEKVTQHRRQALLLKREGRIQQAAAEMKKMKAAEAELAAQKKSQDADMDVAPLVLPAVARPAEQQRPAMGSMAAPQLQELDRQSADGPVAGWQKGNQGGRFQEGAGAVKQSPQEVNLIDLLRDDDDDADVDVTEDDENNPAMAAILNGFGFQEDSKTEGKAAVRDPLEERTAGRKGLVGRTAGVEASTAPKGSEVEDMAALEKELAEAKLKSLELKKAGRMAEATTKFKVYKKLLLQLDDMKIRVQESVRSEPAAMAPLAPAPASERPRQQEAEPPNPWQDSADPFEGEYGDIGTAVGLIEPSRPKPRHSQAPDRKSAMSAVPVPAVQKSHTPVSLPVVSHIQIPVAVPAVQKAQVPMSELILSHKRAALAFKREGRMEEARQELSKAKALERQLAVQGGDSPKGVVPLPRATPTSVPTRPARAPARQPRRVLPPLDDDEDIDEDALDAELSAKLRSLGLMGDEPSKGGNGWFSFGGAKESPKQEVAVVKSGPLKAPVAQVEVAERQSASVGLNRAQFEGEIKALKLKAVKMKNVGKMPEALDALRKSKQLQAQLDASAK